MNENNIKKLIISIPIFGVILTAFFLTNISINQLETYFEKEKNKLIQEEKIKLKNQIKSRVLNTINLLEKSYEQINLNEKKEIKSTVDIAYKIIEKVYLENKGLSKPKIIEKIKEDLEYITFYKNKVGYYFLFDYNGTSLMHPHNGKYEGKNFLILDDLAAQDTIHRFLTFLKHKDEGFLSWKWFKPNESITKEKIGYLKKFEPLDVFVGSAKYEEDIYFSTMKKLQELLNIISFDNQGYIFAFDYTGVTISHAQKSLLGKNRWHLNLDGKYVIQDIVNAAKNDEGSFIEYVASFNPMTNNPASKISFVKSFDKFDWAIGTGVYTSYIDKKIEIKQKELEKELEEMIDKVIIFSAAITFLVVTILYFLINRANSIIQKYKNSLKFLNENLEIKVKKRTKELEDSQEVLKQMAQKDFLTNLFNRRYLNSAYETLMQLSIRNNEPLCLILIDIDKFKNINDTYGHDIGDEVLVQLSNILVSKFRKSDIIARIGGEEFVILFPKTKLDSAYKISEALREKVDNTEFKIADITINFTISVGLTIFDKYEDKKLSSVLKRADCALYEAKRKGRNKVVVYKQKEENEDSYST